MLDLWQRPRRLRATPNVRRLVRETTLSSDHFIYPMFVADGIEDPREIPSMPGQYRHTVSSLVDRAGEALEAGVPAVLLFGVVPADRKDAVGTIGAADDGIVAQAVRALRAAHPDLVVMTDVCLCEYTDHGHCGHIEGGAILNDPSTASLADQALAHARAGAHWVAPSDMMDGRVGVIRARLDAEGFSDVALMAYSAKYASAFYGPFRDAADSTPTFGDRSTYQMDPANLREAMREVELDIAEGADVVMVKPALAYLDVIGAVRTATDLPVAAYNVSGEYSMVHAAAANGWVDGDRIAAEILLAMVRAGADILITYHAVDVARWLRSR